MSSITSEAWPAATLDGVRRLEVLAAVLPGVHLEWRDVDLPFERVWTFMSDIERNVPRFDRDVASVRVTHRDENRLRIVTRTRHGLVVPFRVEIERGFMLMQAPGTRTSSARRRTPSTNVAPDSRTWRACRARSVDSERLALLDTSSPTSRGSRASSTPRNDVARVSDLRRSSR